ncbi:MAG: flagellin FliC [Magnetococcales bacterium]|nr:flagellin FliC [Magnetococcales bacterium]
MALAIASNLQSLNAQRNLEKATSAMGTTFKRLSSGLRINSAKDDAAGLSISNRMTAQIRGQNQAVRNANDAISLVQVADGALDETVTALQRMRELAVQAANDTLISGDREDLQKEVNQMVQEIQRISTNTKFNGQSLVQGSFEAGKIMHVGEDANQTLTVAISAVSVVALGVNSTQVKFFSAAGGYTDASMQVLAESLIGVVDRALNSVTDIRAGLGALQNRFDSIIANLTNIAENTTAARSRILDADIAAETAALTRNAIIQQAGAAILAQANQSPQVAMKLL